MKYKTILLIILFALLGALSTKRRRKGILSESGKSIPDDEWAALKENFAHISDSNTVDIYKGDTYSDGFNYGFIHLSEPKHERKIEIIPRASTDERSFYLSNPDVWFGYFSSPEQNKHQLRLYFVQGISIKNTLGLRTTSGDNKQNILALYIEEPNLETIATVMSLASIFTNFTEMKEDDFNFVQESTYKPALQLDPSDSNKLMFDAIFDYKGPTNQSELVKCNIYAYQQGMVGFIRGELKKDNTVDESKLKLLFGSNYEAFKDQSGNQEMEQKCESIMAENKPQKPEYGKGLLFEEDAYHHRGHQMQEYNDKEEFPRHHQTRTVYSKLPRGPGMHSFMQKSQKISLGKRRKLAKRKKFLKKAWNGLIRFLGYTLTVGVVVLNKTINLISLGFMLFFKAVHRIVTGIANGYEMAVREATIGHPIARSILLFPAELVKGISLFFAAISELPFAFTYSRDMLIELLDQFDHIRTGHLRERPYQRHSHSPVVRLCVSLIRIPVRLLTIE